MSNFFFLLFREKYPTVLGFVVKIILSFFGCKIGKNFKADKFPKLIFAKGKNIIISDNVTFYGNIEIRCYKDSKLIIESNCKLDEGVRIISANDSTVKIEKDNVIGCYTIINGGGNITIGRKGLISSFVSIASSDHGMSKKSLMRDQNFTYGDIIIEEDVLLGSHCTVLKNLKIGKGAIVGANSVVTRSIESFSINVGAPSKVIGHRE